MTLPPFEDLMIPAFATLGGTPCGTFRLPAFEDVGDVVKTFVDRGPLAEPVPCIFEFTRVLEADNLNVKDSELDAVRTSGDGASRTFTIINDESRSGACAA